MLVTVIGVVAMVANVATSGMFRPGESVSAGMTLAFVTTALLVCGASLLVLGKTSKEGTIHGNLLAVAGMGIGLMGTMLAAALWALA